MWSCSKKEKKKNTPKMIFSEMAKFMNLKVSRIHISVIKKLENKNKILQEELKEKNNWDGESRKKLQFLSSINKIIDKLTKK